MLTILWSLQSLQRSRIATPWYNSIRHQNQIDILNIYKVRLVSQSCPTLECSPPGSSVRGILQARILEWVAIPFSKGSSQPRNWTLVSCIVGRFFAVWATRKVLNIYIKQCCYTKNSKSTDTSLYLNAYGRRWRKFAMLRWKWMRIWTRLLNSSFLRSRPGWITI